MMALFLLTQGHSGLVHNCALYFSRMEIPNWFEYQKTGNSLTSFVVPSDFEHDRLQVTVWADYSFGKLSTLTMRFKIYITNITNDDTLTFSLWGSSFEVGSWVRHIPSDYPIKSGDIIEVYLEKRDKHYSEAEKKESNIKVGKYGVHIAKKKQSKQDFKLTSHTKRDLNTNVVESNPALKSKDYVL